MRNIKNLGYSSFPRKRESSVQRTIESGQPKNLGIVVDPSGRETATVLGYLIDTLYETDTLADLWQISKSIQDIGKTLENRVKAKAETYMLDAEIQSFREGDVEFNHIPAKRQMRVNIPLIRQEFPVDEHPEYYMTIQHESYTSVRVHSEVASEPDPDFDDMPEPNAMTKISYADLVGSVRKSKPRAWTAWTVEDERILIQGFQSGMTQNELADLLKRRVGGIRSRLKRLEYISEDSPNRNNTRNQT